MGYPSVTNRPQGFGGTGDEVELEGGVELAMVPVAADP